MRSLTKIIKEAENVSNDLSIQILWMTAEGIEPGTLAAQFGCTTTSIQKRYKRALRELCPHLYDRAQGNWMRTIQNHQAQVQVACLNADKFSSEPLREAKIKTAKAPKPTRIAPVGIRLTHKESQKAASANPIAALIEPKGQIAQFAILFQLSKEQNLTKRIQVVQNIVTHIPGLHEMSLEELMFLLEDPQAVEFIRQRSSQSAA